MPDLLHTLLSFILALAILIAVHEFGHFWVARRLGVKVLRFSIGFGRPLVRWVSRRDGTEYVLAGIPLGGYVKMLDEREEDVDPAEAHMAFNRQKLWKRAAIVLAGPLFNLMFAVLLYWGILVTGDTGSRSLIGTVTPGSIAAEAGLKAGDELLKIGDRATPTWRRRSSPSWTRPWLAATCRCGRGMRMGTSVSWSSMARRWLACRRIRPSSTSWA